MQPDSHAIFTRLQEDVVKDLKKKKKHFIHDISLKYTSILRFFLFYCFSKQNKKFAFQMIRTIFKRDLQLMPPLTSLQCKVSGMSRERLRSVLSRLQRCLRESAGMISISKACICFICIKQGRAQVHLELRGGPNPDQSRHVTCANARN